MKSLSEIHDLEIREDYPAAIDALEERVQADPSDHEAVIRLGFNLWYAVAENSRMKKQLPVDDYAARFMELFEEYQPEMENNADFLWVFGQGLEMFWFFFPGANEPIGKALIKKAEIIDLFYASIWNEDSQIEKDKRFKGRGIFQSYYTKL